MPFLAVKVGSQAFKASISERFILLKQMDSLARPHLAHLALDLAFAFAGLRTAPPVTLIAILSQREAQKELIWQIAQVHRQILKSVQFVSLR